MPTSDPRRPRMLVTGATGKTGSAVARQLLERGYPVTALVRREDSRAAVLARAGATIVVGDLIEPDDLQRVMQGVHRAYFVAPWTPTQLDGAMNFAVAAADARLEAVVAITQWLAQPHHPSVATRQSYLTDRIFAWMPGVETVTINTGWFADNYLGVLPMAAQLGIFPFRLGDARVAPVSSEDIARVAVGALINPAPHVGRFYRPTGPELLDPDQLAATFARVLGRPVRYQELSERLFLKAVASEGLTVHPHHMAQLRHYLEDYRRGSFSIGGITDVVREVGGADPEDFETIVRRHAASDPMSRISLTNTFRTVAALMKILLTPAPHLSAYETTQHQPLLRAPQYGVDHAAWRDTHDARGAFGATTAGQRGHIRLAERPSTLVEPGLVGAPRGEQTVELTA